MRINAVNTVKNILLASVFVAMLFSCSDDDTQNGVSNCNLSSHQFTLTVWNSGADQQEVISTTVSYKNPNGNVITEVLNNKRSSVAIESLPYDEFPDSYEITIEQTVRKGLFRERNEYNLGLGVSLKVICLDNEGHIAKRNSVNSDSPVTITAADLEKKYPMTKIYTVKVTETGQIDISYTTLMKK